MGAGRPTRRKHDGPHPEPAGCALKKDHCSPRPIAAPAPPAALIIEAPARLTARRRWLRHDGRTMSDQRSTEVLTALPRTRPHRRSNKRPARKDGGEAGASTAAAGEAPAPTTGPGSAARPSGARAAQSRAKAKAPTGRDSSAAKRGGPSPSPAGRTALSSSTAQPPVLKPTPLRGKPSRATRPKRLPQPAQPAGVPAAAGSRRPEPPTRMPIVSTAVQAAAELAEIGLSLGSRALRGAVGRIPKP